MFSERSVRASVGSFSLALSLSCRNLWKHRRSRPSGCHSSEERSMCDIDRRRRSAKRERRTAVPWSWNIEGRRRGIWVPRGVWLLVFFRFRRVNEGHFVQGGPTGWSLSAMNFCLGTGLSISEACRSRTLAASWRVVLAVLVIVMGGLIRRKDKESGGMSTRSLGATLTSGGVAIRSEGRFRTRARPRRTASLSA